LQKRASSYAKYSFFSTHFQNSLKSATDLAENRQKVREIHTKVVKKMAKIIVFWCEIGQSIISGITVATKSQRHEAAFGIWIKFVEFGKSSDIILFVMDETAEEKLES
jgi:hypothetical protein